jgi:hypothetical protein
VRCTTGAGAGGGGGAVLVLEREMQPEPSVAAAKTSPRDKNFIMQVPQAKASLRMLPTVSRNDDREKCFGAAAQQITPSAAASGLPRSICRVPPMLKSNSTLRSKRT